MYTFSFYYADGKIAHYRNVNRIIIHAQTKNIELSGEDILSACIPLRTISLFSENNNCTVSANNVIRIEVLKQKD